MRDNSFGKLLTITTAGESHSHGLGVIIDGMPAEIEINEQDLKDLLTRRSPGNHPTATSRKEEDVFTIYSGIFENKTLGTPILVTVENRNQKSSDYDSLKNQFRPGHADKTTLDKFGFRDHRGGGRASGRETVSRVIGGYFASLLLPKSLQIHTFIRQMGEIDLSNRKYTSPQGYFGLADLQDEPRIHDLLLECKKEGDSVGGEMYIEIEGAPAGLGGPIFDKLKAEIAKAMLSIGGVMGIQFGEGFHFIQKRGKEISLDTTAFGGIEGGISNGKNITFSLAFKAPSTVGKNAKEGRHDPCIMPRARVVVEAMAIHVLANALQANKLL